MASVFKLHVIPPPGTLDWRSPRVLLVKTLWHHLINDHFPIGHYFIEIESDSPNAYGVNHVITGMSRLQKNRSTIKVIRDKVGMGSFYYDFPGCLDLSSVALQQLQWAKKRSRLKTVSIELSPERARLLMDELHQWIEKGSFRHYGGGHQILKGEGSGCAEMGAHFFNLALGHQALPEAWVRSVYAPKHLVGGSRTGLKVSMLEVYLKGLAWAEGPESGILYASPDMELTWKWLETHFPGQNEITMTAGQMGEGKPIATRISFESGYPHESEAVIRNEWSRISVKR